MLAILAPVALGPATGAIARALGAFDHACACGMAPGTCGCPACQQLRRQQEEGHHALPVLESNCERDGSAVPGAPLPPGVLPAQLTPGVLALRESLPAFSLAQVHLAEKDGPPTPPPRA